MMNNHTYFSMLLKRWLKYFSRIFSVVLVLTFLAYNFLQPTLLSIQTAHATDDEGLGVSFDDNGSYSTNLSANIINNGTNPAGSLTVQLGVYHCKTAGTSACAPDLAPDDLADDSARSASNISIDIPAPGTSTTTSVGVPAYSCGRVQVDIGREGHGILGGRTFSLGSDCVTAPPPAQCSEVRQYNECIACNTSRRISQDSCGNFTTLVASQPDSACASWCPAPIPTPPPPAPQCSYGSTQARVQKSLSDPWDSSKTISSGEQIRVGGFHDNTGQFASDANLAVTGPQNFSNLGNGQFITPTAAGSYTLTVTTQNQSGPACEDRASFQVQAAAQPQAPACDANQLNMSVSPNPVMVGDSITFTNSVGSTQGSTWIGDSWSGGVDCSGNFWGSKTCRATSAGNFSWTHTWQNTAPNNFDIKSPQCAKTVNFSVAVPACVPNGSCSAPAPACGTTTTGVDNCGNACSKQGPACPIVSPPPVAQIICQPALQTVQVNQFASLVSNDTGRPIFWSAPNGNPSSGSGTSFSTRFAQSGTFNVIVNDGLTRDICRVVVQLAPVPTPTPTPTPTPVPVADQNITLNCPDGSSIRVAAGQNVNFNALCQAQQQQQNQVATAVATGGTSTITFGNVGVAAAPQPVVIQPAAVVQPVVVQPAVVPQVAGVAVTQLPKTGLPLLAWSALSFIPAGFGLRRFRKVNKDFEDNPQFIWEDRKFKAGS